jgi:predicted metal-dependent phosphoesterase TrpH
MIIDFHTHSHASDGALPPRELIDQAIAAGVGMFAITDHDTVAGYCEALDSPTPLPADFRLISGIEMSCQWANCTIHVLGLDMDIEHEVLRSALVTLAAARQERATIIGARLEKAGMSGALEGALSVAGRSQVGRPHFASWMVAQGHVETVNKAFDKYLGAGKMGDVKACWPQLDEVVQWIVQSGGTAILAHPLKYRFTRMKLKRLLRAFVTAGGSALEVFSGRQQQDRTLDLCKLAVEFNLLASAGSDFHRHYEYGPGLGVDCDRLPSIAALWQPGKQGETG